ncbi:hypothetical protein FIV42_02825 [Persicimonas caeni]|uniref:Uncharacterized protein n=1 Tax=Persicimonas caeni TaxID=2292766 RepID=A0A4Y6PNB4_PERCE|nr:hypothetical protein [Persicimonas caeni]QDG49709.1 hypothetical protein FIV42_02825 [Persicimonas caeni]QED30930.1 hypothetical protein FRD00_02820 [Persicimonas caeni]
MTIGKRDARFSKESKAACTNARGVTLDGGADVVRNTVLAYVEPIFAEFDSAISAEDRAETKLNASVVKMEQVEAEAGRSFAAMHSGLQTGVAFAHAAPDRTDVDVDNLENYLDAMSPSDFRRLSRAETLVQFERTHGYLGDFLPTELESRIKPLADDTLAKLKAMADEQEQSNAEWLQEQADLETARNKAKEAYVTLRDGMATALRMVGMHERLNQIVKPLHRALYATSGSDEPSEPAEPAEPVAPSDPVPVPNE